jgi:hypothetical protein
VGQEKLAAVQENSRQCAVFSTGVWRLDRLCGLLVRVPGYRSRFDSQRYQIFWEVVGLEPGPLSLVCTIEELLGRKSSSSRLESQEYGRRDPSRWPRATLYPQKLELISPTNGGRSVGIVRSRTQATEFSLVSVWRFISGLQSQIVLARSWNSYEGLSWYKCDYCWIINLPQQDSSVYQQYDVKMWKWKAR